MSFCCCGCGFSLLFFSSRIRLFRNSWKNSIHYKKAHSIRWCHLELLFRNQQVLSVGDLVLRMVAIHSNDKRKIQTINRPTPTNYFFSVFNHTAVYYTTWWEMRTSKASLQVENTRKILKPKRHCKIPLTILLATEIVNVGNYFLLIL